MQPVSTAFDAARNLFPASAAAAAGVKDDTAEETAAAAAAAAAAHKARPSVDSLSAESITAATAAAAADSALAAAASNLKTAEAAVAGVHQHISSNRRSRLEDEVFSALRAILHVPSIAAAPGAACAFVSASVTAAAAVSSVVATCREPTATFVAARISERSMAPAAAAEAAAVSAPVAHLPVARRQPASSLPLGDAQDVTSMWRRQAHIYSDRKKVASSLQHYISPGDDRQMRPQHPMQPWTEQWEIRRSCEVLHLYSIDILLRKSVSFLSDLQEPQTR